MQGTQISCFLASIRYRLIGFSSKERSSTMNSTNKSNNSHCHQRWHLEDEEREEEEEEVSNDTDGLFGLIYSFYDRKTNTTIDIVSSRSKTKLSSPSTTENSSITNEQLESCCTLPSRSTPRTKKKRIRFSNSCADSCSDFGGIDEVIDEKEDKQGEPITTCTAINVRLGIGIGEIETDLEAGPDLDSVTSSITMPRKQVQRGSQKKQTKKKSSSSTRTVNEVNDNDDQTQASRGTLSSYSTTTSSSTTKGKRGDKSGSGGWNLSWIMGMIAVSAFVAIGAVVVSRTARGFSIDPKITSADENYNNNNNDQSRLSSTSSTSFASFDGVATITNQYNVIDTYDHDPTSFTQGLLVHEGTLIESTGVYGDSLVRRWEPTTGNILTENNEIDAKYFGEGITWYVDAEGNERFVMLTWMERTAFIFDTKTLEVLDTFEYTTHTKQGWGITFDPNQKLFYVSDGSEYITVWNLEFEEIDRFPVSITLPRLNNDKQQEEGDGSSPAIFTRPLHLINELEWDETTGTVLANVFMQNAIVRILPHSGKVAKVYDLSQLYTNRTPKSDVLNGIAKHPTKANHYWITGKYWPHIYLLEMR